MGPTPTTPPRNMSIFLRSTPIHSQSSTTDGYFSRHEAREETFDQLSGKMDPYFDGPLPPEEFLDQFMSQPSGNLALPHFIDGMFSGMSKSSKETTMRHEFVCFKSYLFS